VATWEMKLPFSLDSCAGCVSLMDKQISMAKIGSMRRAP